MGSLGAEAENEDRHEKSQRKIRNQLLNAAGELGILVDDRRSSGEIAAVLLNERARQRR